MKTDLEDYELEQRRMLAWIELFNSITEKQPAPFIVEQTSLENEQV